jgi:hypothetical protein
MIPRTHLASASSPSLALAIAFLLVAPSGAAWSQTADGTTPAEEGVCDELHDATPGLYGLCVAYCEAQDCDSVEQAVSGQCRAPSPKLLELYDRKRSADDPSMPCESTPPPPCPCFAVEDLAALELDTCLEFDFGFDLLAISDADMENGAISERGAGWGLCTLTVDGAAVVREIDEEQAFACESLIRYHALESQITCEAGF